MQTLLKNIWSCLMFNRYLQLCKNIDINRLELLSIMWLGKDNELYIIFFQFFLVFITVFAWKYYAEIIVITRAVLGGMYIDTSLCLSLSLSVSISVSLSLSLYISLLRFIFEKNVALHLLQLALFMTFFTDDDDVLYWKE